MDYKNGDTITLEHPNGSRIVGTIRDDVITIGGLSFDLRVVPGFTITHVEPAPVPLPTMPGLYVAYNNRGDLSSAWIYQLRGGEWSLLNGNEVAGGNHHEYAHNHLGGLVRLVPEA